MRPPALRDIPHIITTRGDLALDDAASVVRALDRLRPWAVINAAGWVRVDEAEEDPDACMQSNAHNVVSLADACAHRGIPTVNFSSDLCFDGLKGSAYFEDDLPCPLNVYGKSKAAMENLWPTFPAPILLSAPPPSSPPSTSTISLCGCRRAQKQSDVRSCR